MRSCRNTLGEIIQRMVSRLIAIRVGLTSPSRICTTVITFQERKRQPGSVNRMLGRNAQGATRFDPVCRMSLDATYVLRLVMTRLK